MNPIGAFSLGRILKTLLPGFIALIALGIGLDTRFHWLYQTRPVWAWVNLNSTAAAFAAVPLSLVAGMVLNTLTFTYLLDPLVRRPHLAKHPEFTALWGDIAQRLRDKTESGSAFSGESESFWDLEYFLLPIVPMDKYTFLEESYWYFMEFSLNILLALLLNGAAIASAMVSRYLQSPPGASFPWISLLFVAILMALLARALTASARRSFEKHSMKKLSLLLGSLHAKETFQ